MRQAGLFGLSEHLKRLSAQGDPLEELDTSKNRWRVAA
jgi:transposase, IS5 family